MKKIASYHIAILLFALAFVVACSTSKNKFMNRAYHNMTSRYNGYFYARESMKDAQSKIEKSYVDDYSQLLPIFRLPNSTETKGCYTDLEKAIKKSTSVIDKHAITKPKPKRSTAQAEEIPGAVKWIDDNYLIIGQAHYYKGEYLAAIDIFDYLIQKYSKFPIRYDAIMWKARTEVEMNAYTEAESLLDVIANDKACPPRLEADIKATYADLYMHTGNYPNAIKNLEEAIKLTKSKKTLARYTYILAQLYEKTGKEKDAYDAYAKVISLHPQYDMLFNAKLSRARLSGMSSKSRNESKKELQEMLKDGKNVEFQDQIYYTLAQMEMRAGNREAAMGYYRQSVATSMGNNKQKALSYLALGDLYFADTDYKNAQAYYDSTMNVLPKDYPQYESISEKRKSLSTLVRYINIVATEDSLQNIVKTYGNDTTKLYPYIDKLIAQAQAEEKRRKEALEQQQQGGGGTGLGQNNQNNAGGPASMFYFYNPSNISFGVNEFTRKWGNRKLEDNWRRANKESVVEDDNDDDEQDTVKTTASTKGAATGKYSRAYYLKNLPFTSAQQMQSDEKIADALYNLGTLYKEQMGNNTKAADAFESLCKRYPSHKYALPAHFQLYKIYSDNKPGNKMLDKANADRHKFYILNNYPESEYAKLINNPDYEVQAQGEKDKLYAYYDSTYSIYLKRDYPQVISRANMADSTFGRKNELAAKFAYLRAVSLGKTSGTPAMEAELTRIIANYPKDPIRPQAQALLDFIHKQNGTGGNSSAPKDTVNAQTGPAYTANDNVEFQYMVVVETGKGDLNKFRIALSDFNNSMFASSNLAITSIVLDNKHQCIMVKKFANKAEALNYYNLLKSKPEIFAELTPGSYQVMAISTENFALFFKDKNVETYRSFFEKNVLGKK